MKKNTGRASDLQRRSPEDAGGYRYIFQNFDSQLLYTTDEIPADLWSPRIPQAPDGFRWWGIVRPDGSAQAATINAAGAWQLTVGSYRSIGAARASVITKQLAAREERETEAVAREAHDAAIKSFRARAE